MAPGKTTSIQLSAVQLHKAGWENFTSSEQSQGLVINFNSKIDQAGEGK
jgi:hypothetical protein